MRSPTTTPAPSTAFTVRSDCRACGAGDLETVLDLGFVPLVDVLPGPGDLAEPDEVYPLSVGWCSSCSLLQTLQDVPAARLFDERYVYRSGASAGLVAAARDQAAGLIRECRLGTDDLVVEVASNDGTLLSRFAGVGVPTLGIDPVAAVAAEARRRGVTTLERFFDRDLAADLVADGVRADVLVGNNVLAHVESLASFLDGVALLLRPDGVARFDVPWVLPMVQRVAFDLAYHEHRCHFSVTALEPLLRRHGLVLVHVDHLDAQGGSLRLHVVHAGAGVGPDRTVAGAEAAERDAGLVGGAAWPRFAAAVDDAVDALRTTIADHRREHGPMGAYGAAAKGALLANVVGITADDVAFVVDRNAAKHGRHLPGVRIPIAPVQRLAEARTALLLAWNVEGEVRRQQADWIAGGGQFLVPLPRPRLVPA